MVLVLSRDDLKSILTMKDVIDAVEEAFKCYGLGKASMPPRPVIKVEGYNGLILYMPAYIADMDALAVKIVSVYPDNPKKYALPTTLGTVLLNDPRTGDLLAIMEGAFITAMRTGAVSGVASKYLARSDSRIVGIFGAGVQARTQLMALCEVRPIEEARVYDVIYSASKKYADEMSKQLGIDVRPVENPVEAVKGCDIIVTATTSKTPVFRGEWVEDGTHINGIGSHTPTSRELDSNIIMRAKVVVDSIEACFREAGDIIIPINEGVIGRDHIYAELSELVTGAKPGRVNDKEITIFKSVGLAIQDASTALKAYRLALKKGVGKEISL
ncbi:MAG: ornithine cyclodeaminase family protein [archaeon GB-1867-005]|nr:ornithine cyclodeaminase family protein [Candidatus Culexmicrobium cathedralense]